MTRIARTLAFAILAFTLAAQAQDWVRTGTNLGNERIRLAAADFKPFGSDPGLASLKAAFDTTLFTDLQNAGIFDVVAKSMAPVATPGTPQEATLEQWSAAPSNAAMLAMGSLTVNGGKMSVAGWLLDTRNPANPQILAKQYFDDPSQDAVRSTAHKFADEIILRLGGGLNGIAETRIYFVSARSGTKEIWAMDYDGANLHQVTHLGAVASLSPRVSPDNSRIAFASLNDKGWAIRMYSLDLGRMVSFPAGTAGGSNQSPAWSSDGSKLAFSSSRAGTPSIWVADANGANPRRITSFQGPDVSPTWNPRTNAQIAWVSGRTGLPQIYTMDEDGSNVQRLTDGGYAISPSWAPNGGLLTFSWNRKYGPGAPGGQDIYVMDISTKPLKWLQLTHDSGSNDFPFWAPDGRHIVFERTLGKRTDIWSMLADGTDQHQLTTSGNNFMPNWSWR